MAEQTMTYMMRKFARRAMPARRIAAAAGAALLLLAAGCGTKDQTMPAHGKPVSGRTATGTGVSLDFPEGWAEVEVEGRPFTKLYENDARQLALGLGEFPSNGLSISTLGDQMQRRLGSDGTIKEGALTTIDGHPAYRVFSEQKTATGHGLVIGLTIMRGDRVSTVFLFSQGDEKVNHRPEMEAFLQTLKVV